MNITTIQNELLDTKFECDYEYVTQLNENDQKQFKLKKSTIITFREIYYYLKENEPGHFRDFNKHLIPFYLIKHILNVIKWSVILKTSKVKLLPNVKVPIQIIETLTKDDPENVMKRYREEYKNVKFIKDSFVDLFLFNYFASCFSIFNYFRSDDKHKNILQKVFTKRFQFDYDFGNENLNKFILKERINLCPFDVVMILNQNGDFGKYLSPFSDYLDGFKDKSTLYGHALKCNLIKK